MLLFDKDPSLAAHGNGKKHPHAPSYKPSQKSSFSRSLGRLVPGWAQVALMGVMIAQSVPLQWGMMSQSSLETKMQGVPRRTHCRKGVRTANNPAAGWKDFFAFVRGYNFLPDSVKRSFKSHYLIIQTPSQ